METFMKVIKYLLAPFIMTAIAIVLAHKLDVYNVIVAVFAYVSLGIGILVWRWKKMKEKDQMESLAPELAADMNMFDQGEQPLWILAKGFAFGIGVIVLMFALVFISRWTPLYGMYYDQGYEADKTYVQTFQNDGERAIVEAEKVIVKGLSPEKEYELANIAAGYLQGETEKLPDESSEKVRKMGLLRDFALQHGLSDKAGIAVAYLKPTPTPRPTYTAQPTFTTVPTQTALPTYTPAATWTPFPTATNTPLPTGTPLPTPTRILVAGKSNPCQPPARPYKEENLIVPARNGFSKDLNTASNGLFTRGLFVLDFQKGDEICFSSSPDGRSAPKVDDQAVISTKKNGVTIARFVIPFYDPTSAGISSWPAQDITWMFPESGSYTLEVELYDIVPPVWSATDLHITIW